MEQPYQHKDNTIYFEVSKGRGTLHYDGRKASVVPPSVELVLHAIDNLVHPVMAQHAEFYVLPKQDEETSQVPILSPEERKHVTLEGKTLRLASGKITLHD